MPPTTNFKFGDVVLAPFPFTDQTATKQRPAVVVSSDRYNASRPDLMLMPITSQVAASPVFGEVTVVEWQKAGLLSYSVIKPILTTTEKRLVIKKLGRLVDRDRTAVQSVLQTILG
jgi:mRNA interferase MazF